MKHTRWNLLGGASLLALVLLTACGGSDGENPPDPNNDPVNHDEFTINGADLGEHTRQQSVLALADNQFVALWNNSTLNVAHPSNMVHPSPAFRAEGYGQRIDAKGRKAGTEISLSTKLYYTDGSGPVGAALSGGGWLSIWTELANCNPLCSDVVTGRRFDPMGAAVGGAIAISAGDGQAYVPTLGSGPTGASVAAWRDDAQRLKAQRLAEDGSLTGNPINLGRSGGALQVAVEPDGSFVVAWFNGDQGLTLVQRYSASGAALGGSLVLDNTRSGSVAIESTPGGGWVYAGGSGVQRYAQDGSKLGAAVPLPDSFGHALGVGQDGKFVVAWAQRVDSTTFNIQAQRFAADGSKVGDTFQVNTIAAPQVETPSVAVAPNGRFLITWIKYKANHTPDTLEGRLFEP